MQQFVTGFVVALLAAIPVVWWLRGRKTDKSDGSQREYLRQLEELGKLTGELVHEIKNPLSTIKVNLKLIGEELEDLRGADSRSRDEAKLARALRKTSVVEKEANRLEQILEGFLRYIAKTELQPINVNINELVSDMIDFYSPQSHSHSITIRQGLHDKPLVCKVDADMLKQVILNLFINAQQAMSDGGELMIRTNRQNEEAVIQISDTGSGIAADKLGRIFDPYYSSRLHGSGLGLASAKRIVEAHKGTLSVSSEIGKGSSFMIKLPLCSN